MQDLDLVDKLGALLTSRNLKLVTAESCTGGLLSATITHKPGASKFFECGFITYSNQAKVEILKVPVQMIDMNGAVSSQTAESMARGAIKNSRGDVAISITGVAGPDGGTAGKPVGLVYFALAFKKDGSARHIEHRFQGSRAAIQKSAVSAALKFLMDALEEEK
jgi:nicotinamide-nucleotide amidase